MLPAHWSFCFMYHSAFQFVVGRLHFCLLSVCYGKTDGQMGLKCCDCSCVCVCVCVCVWVCLAVCCGSVYVRFRVAAMWVYVFEDSACVCDDFMCSLSPRMKIVRVCVWCVCGVCVAVCV